PLGFDDTSTEFIYPNPTTGLIQLKINADVKEIQIISLDGKELWKSEKPTKEIDLSNLPKGLYMIKIKTDEGEFETPLVLK
ncbi:MAG: T9SS type A sorting domain-containing protein, partial [Cyclobacteriaceae bacterium]|nr:T9SS type A sorting domain-containing protein [Cyclobacteriaceae bacterium HetDA_MAG_MS6]